LIDEVLQVSNDEAFAMARRLAKEEGILGGIVVRRSGPGRR